MIQQRISFENEIKLNYVKKWEESSYESNYIELDIKEDEYIKYTQEKNNTIDREVRIHAEIETVLSETILVIIKLDCKIIQNTFINK